MEYGWDDAKRRSNLEKHAVDFASVELFAWPYALVRADLRGDWVEVRLIAMAPIGRRLHVLVFTLWRSQIRVISLRRANNKEIVRYEAEA